MDIKYLGHSSFLLRGKNVCLVTDPYESEMVGLKFPKHTACDIVCVSHDHADHNAIDVLEGNPFVVSGPGEYEIKGVEIIGISSFHDNQKGRERGENTIYRMEIDGISVVSLGDLGHSLSVSDVDLLDGVSVLLIPVGGHYTINAHEAATIVAEIEPSIVIPKHYGSPALNQKNFGELSPVDLFLKEMGKDNVVKQQKLSLTKDKIPQELQVVVLEY